MDRATQAMRQRIGRMKNNLGLSEKRDELASVASIDQLNQKAISAIVTFRKNLSSNIKTGLREEEPKKRVKKCDDYPLSQDLITDGKELELQGSTCLSKALTGMSEVLQKVMYQRVTTEQQIEKRVLDGLARYLEMDKALTKSKERLNNTIVDVDIARKALHSKGHDEVKANELQEDLDSTLLKLESLKDSTITDIFTLAAKEQDIALVCLYYLEELLEYHRFALRNFESSLSEIRRGISNARPRKMFSEDLEVHLTHSGRSISVVLEKCCHILRHNGMRERGVFRVNGNNTKIRRMKAAFDAGQIEDEAEAYAHDPHSVCSVLKSYLRELPDPLLTNRLYPDWVTATKLEGEERVKFVENCLTHLPRAHYDNLAYLINFLCDLLQYEDTTMMNANNLAIVFGPNLIGVENQSDTDNITGSKIVETLLLNEERLFGRSHYYQPHSRVGSFSDATHSISRTNSYSTSHRLQSSVGSAAGRSMLAGSGAAAVVTGTPPLRSSFTGQLHSQHPSGANPSPTPIHNTTLHVDTHASLRASTKSLSASPNESPSFTNSPRGARRPRITAPLPPSAASSSSAKGNVGAEMSRSMTSASGGPQAVSCPRAPLAGQDDRFDQFASIRSNLALFEARAQGNELGSRSSSLDSFDEYDDDSGTRSLDRPLRPPPPTMRSNSNAQTKARPVSYNIAVGSTGNGVAVDEGRAKMAPLVGGASGSGRESGDSASSAASSASVHSQANPQAPPRQSPVAGQQPQAASAQLHRSVISIDGPVPPGRTGRPPVPAKPKAMDGGPSTVPLLPQHSSQEAALVDGSADAPPLGVAPKQSKETTKL